MKERPILMSAPMVRALLEGRKTQTRRVMKDAPIERGGYLCTKLITFANEKQVRGIMPSLCPYGNPGDKLWVREAWQTGAKIDKFNATEIAKKAVAAGFSASAPLRYPADGHWTKWGHNDKGDFGDWGRYRHSRFMPRWASRITLEITEVRVQRLREISALDAVDEGVMVLGPDWIAEQFPIYAADYAQWKRLALSNIAPPLGPGPVQRYAALWQEINGPGSWDTNPWVWALTFRREG